MNNRISGTIQRLFPKDFDEIKPAGRSAWEKLDFERLMKSWAVWVLAAVTFVFLVGLVQYWNRVINAECAVITASHQVEVAEQRRKNIVEELTQNVVAYASYERGMFKYMTDKRGDLKPPAEEQIAELAKQSRLLGDSTKTDGINFEKFMSRFRAIAENYPHLKLSENYQILMGAMMEVTKQIADRRLQYNEELLGYKTYIHSFPNMIYTWLLRVRDYDYAQVDKSVHLLVPLDNRIDQTV